MIIDRFDTDRTRRIISIRSGREIAVRAFSSAFPMQKVKNMAHHHGARLFIKPLCLSIRSPMSVANTFSKYQQTTQSLQMISLNHLLCTGNAV